MFEKNKSSSIPPKTPLPSSRPPNFRELCENFSTKITKKLDSWSSYWTPFRLELKTGESLVLLGETFKVENDDNQERKKLINETIRRKYNEIIWFSYRTSFPIIEGESNKKKSKKQKKIQK